MILHLEPSTMAVCLSSQTVSRLLDLRETQEETLDAIVSRLAVVPSPSREGNGFSRTQGGSIGRSAEKEARHSLMLFDETVSADSLGRLFAEFIDLLDLYFPDVLISLAEKRARSRRYLARKPEEVHAGRLDLAIIQTRSGWWVSANIGQDDLFRALRVVCDITGLEMERDIQVRTSPPTRHSTTGVGGR